MHQTAFLEEKREHLIQFSGQNLNTTELIAEAPGDIRQTSQWCLELVENDIFICQEWVLILLEMLILWRNFFCCFWDLELNIWTFLKNYLGIQRPLVCLLSDARQSSIFCRSHRIVEKDPEERSWTKSPILEKTVRLREVNYFHQTRTRGQVSGLSVPWSFQEVSISHNIAKV